MELKTLFPNLNAMWVRWSEYHIAEQSGVRYLMPTAHAAEIPYSYVDQINEMLTDALNLGGAAYREAPDIDRACIEFARKYGLLGISHSAGHKTLLDPEAMAPIHREPHRQDYGEPVDHFAAEFLTLYLHFLSARGELPAQLPTYHRSLLSAMTEAPIPGGMSYRLTTGQPPQLLWEPDKLLSVLRLAYGLAVTDPAAPLKVCKNCGQIYYNTHAKSEFCGTKCRNYYNVKVFRAKEKKSE